MRVTFCEVKISLVSVTCYSLQPLTMTVHSDDRPIITGGMNEPCNSGSFVTDME